jgi:hypothetical protein
MISIAGAAIATPADLLLYNNDNIGPESAYRPSPAGIAISEDRRSVDSIFFRVPILSFIVQQYTTFGKALFPNTPVKAGIKLNIEKANEYAPYIKVPKRSTVKLSAGTIFPKSLVISSKLFLNAEVIALVTVKVSTSVARFSTKAPMDIGIAILTKLLRTLFPL